MALQKNDTNNLHSGAMIDAAVQVAKKVKAKAVLIYVDSLDDLSAVAEKVKKVTQLILVARDDKDELRGKEHAEPINGDFRAEDLQGRQLPDDEVRVRVHGLPQFDEAISAVS